MAPITWQAADIRRLFPEIERWRQVISAWYVLNPGEVMKDNPYEPPETNEPSDHRRVSGLQWNDLILPGVAILLGIALAGIMAML